MRICPVKWLVSTSNNAVTVRNYLEYLTLLDTANRQYLQVCAIRKGCTSHLKLPCIDFSFDNVFVIIYLYVLAVF